MEQLAASVRTRSEREAAVERNIAHTRERFGVEVTGADLEAAREMLRRIRAGELGEVA
ncbi:hypothetical protein [Streptacidiphilus sp. PAMC 29251]